MVGYPGNAWLVGLITRGVTSQLNLQMRTQDVKPYNRTQSTNYFMMGSVKRKWIQDYFITKDTE